MFIKYDTPSLIHRIENLNRRHAHTFRLPKKSGGYRKITAYDSEYTDKANRLKATLEIHPTHKNAIAYTKGVNYKEIIRNKHSKDMYFYKFDFKAFFTSFNTSNMDVFKDLGLTQIDLSYILGKRTATSSALAQGHPLSPTITNKIMWWFDEGITRVAEKQGFNYSRYADDILISSKHRMDPKWVKKLIRNALDRNKLGFLKLNNAKTADTKMGGKTYFLGLSINKQTGIGVGHKKIRKFRKKVAFINKMGDKKIILTSLAATTKNLLNEYIYIKSIHKDFDCDTTKLYGYLRQYIRIGYIDTGEYNVSKDTQILQLFNTKGIV